MSEFGEGQAICLPLPRKFTYNGGEVSKRAHNSNLSVVDIDKFSPNRVLAIPQSPVFSQELAPAVW